MLEKRDMNQGWTPQSIKAIKEQYGLSFFFFLPFNYKQIKSFIFSLGRPGCYKKNFIRVI